MHWREAERIYIEKFIKKREKIEHSINVYIKNFI